MSNLSDFLSSVGGTLEEVVHNTAYTFVAGDELGKLHVSNDATPYTWTIPLNATVPFEVGSTFAIYNGGAGDITITADGAATLTNVGSGIDGDRSVTQYAIATILKVDTDTWRMTGGSTGPSGSVTPTTGKIIFLGTQ